MPVQNDKALDSESLKNVLICETYRYSDAKNVIFLKYMMELRFSHSKKSKISFIFE
jgi:hypothetical protein